MHAYRNQKTAGMIIPILKKKKHNLNIKVLLETKRTFYSNKTISSSGTSKNSKQIHT